jgi:hypothetical protein
MFANDGNIDGGSYCYLEQYNYQTNWLNIGLNSEVIVNTIFFLWEFDYFSLNFNLDLEFQVGNSAP